MRHPGRFQRGRGELRKAASRQSRLCRRLFPVRPAAGASFAHPGSKTHAHARHRSRSPKRRSSRQLGNGNGAGAIARIIVPGLSMMAGPDPPGQVLQFPYPKMTTQHIPLFPLNVVLLPGMSLPLHIFEPRYKRMIKTVIDDESPFGVVLARETGMATVGCTAMVRRVVRTYP